MGDIEIPIHKIEYLQNRLEQTLRNNLHKKGRIDEMPKLNSIVKNYGILSADILEKTNVKLSARFLQSFFYDVKKLKKINETTKTIRESNLHVILTYTNTIIGDNQFLGLLEIKVVDDEYCLSKYSQKSFYTNSQFEIVLRMLNDFYSQEKFCIELSKSSIDDKKMAVILDHFIFKDFNQSMIRLMQGDFFLITRDETIDLSDSKTLNDNQKIIIEHFLKFSYFLMRHWCICSIDKPIQSFG